MRADDWPIGMGKRFRDVYHLYDDTIAFFDPQAEKGTAEIIRGLDNPRLDELIGSQADELRSDIELVRGASHAFDAEAYLNGKQSPVFFGSAVNNFGVQSLLDAVVDLSPAPIARPAVSRRVERASRNSPASCSRSRPTWTPSIVTASPSCASVPGVSNAA